MPIGLRPKARRAETRYGNARGNLLTWRNVSQGDIYAGLAGGFDHRSMFRRDHLCDGPEVFLRAGPPISRPSGSVLTEAIREKNPMSDSLKVLIICRHNSGRSQIAEAYLQRLAGDRAEVESAGLEPAAAVNPLVVEVMKEEGFNLSQKKPQSVFGLFKQGRLFDHVITVCSDTEQQCPLFPGITRRWHMPFPDPSKATGTRDEQLTQVRTIREMIKAWLLSPGPDDFASKVGLLG